MRPALRVEIGHRASHREMDDAIRMRGFSRLVSDQRPIAQDDDSIGDAEDLRQLVGDEDDRDAAIRSFATIS